MGIKFFTRSGQIIPTGFALVIDEKLIVRYNKMSDYEDGSFAYGFIFENGLDYDQEYIDSALEEIVSTLCTQSFDHWARWRELRDRRYKEEVSATNEVVYLVFFYIRDSY